MKRALFCVIIAAILVSTGCMKEVAKQIDILPPRERKSPQINYLPIQLANDGVKIDSLIAYYDPMSNIVTEFEINDKTGSIHYFGGTSDQNKYIWCYLADSANGRINEIKEFHTSEFVYELTQKCAIGIVMDHSGSIGDNREYILQNGIYNLICQKDLDDGFFILKFDERGEIEVSVTNDKDVLKRKFKKVGLEGYGNNTALNDALDLAIAHLEPVSGYDQKILFLCSDGNENESALDKELIVEKARSKNIKIYAIGLGEEVNESYMKYLATETKGKYYRIYQAVEFQTIFSYIYSQFLIRPMKYRIVYKPKEFSSEHYVKFSLCLPAGTVTKTVEVLIREKDVLYLNVLFEFNSDVIQPSSYAEIEKVANYLKNNPSITIRLDGHTDCRGSREYDLDLSVRRANAVKNFLAGKGISGSRIETTGYGFDRPYVVDINDNQKYPFLPIGKVLTCDFIGSSYLETERQKETAHSLNRRTQLVVTKK
jgi:outer membrane protein OmpA-like peptidoglycan-associated protein